jgi:hypothetical protein
MNRFLPRLSSEAVAPPFDFTENKQDKAWIPVLVCPAGFPAELVRVPPVKS